MWLSVPLLIMPSATTITVIVVDYFFCFGEWFERISVDQCTCFLVLQLVPPSRTYSWVDRKYPHHFFKGIVDYTTTTANNDNDNNDNCGYFVLTAKNRGKIKENEKMVKILNLARELYRKLRNMKITVILVVDGVLETVPSRLGEDWRNLEIRGRIDIIQTTEIL